MAFSMARSDLVGSDLTGSDLTMERSDRIPLDRVGWGRVGRVQSTVWEKLAVVHFTTIATFRLEYEYDFQT